jgi:hypothetical protein
VAIAGKSERWTSRKWPSWALFGRCSGCWTKGDCTVGNERVAIGGTRAKRGRREEEESISVGLVWLVVV